MIGNPDRNFRADRLVDGETLSYLKPRRSAGRIVRLYKWRAMAFVAVLVVVFLFAAMGKVGN